MAERRRRSVVRGAIAGLVLTALVTFVVVGAATTLVSRNIAESSALGEATRSATNLGTVLFTPVIPDLVAGNGDATTKLDNALADRRRAGVLTRATLWRGDGRVVYSDDPSLRGRTLAVPSMVRNAVERNATSGSLADTVPGTNRSGSFVDAYVPLESNGERFALELVTDDERVQAASDDIGSSLIPLVLLSLLLLVLAQLPVSAWLVRSVLKAEEDRGRLLRSALTASDRERRAIARDLHDGVVQDLAAAGYALGAVRQTLSDDLPETSRQMVQRASDVVRGSVGSLRTLMVDIYPPDLAETGLAPALTELGTRLPGTTVDVTVDASARPSPELAAALYRCARECVTNIGKHAHAEHAWIDLSTGPGTLRLLVADDGAGLPADLAARQTNGHIGMRLLQDSVRDLGGTMLLRPRDAGGTEVLVELPSN